MARQTQFSTAFGKVRRLAEVRQMAIAAIAGKIGLVSRRGRESFRFNFVTLAAEVVGFGAKDSGLPSLVGTVTSQAIIYGGVHHGRGFFPVGKVFVAIEAERGVISFNQPGMVRAVNLVAATTLTGHGRHVRRHARTVQNVIVALTSQASLVGAEQIAES